MQITQVTQMVNLINSDYQKYKKNYLYNSCSNLYFDTPSSLKRISHCKVKSEITSEIGMCNWKTFFPFFGINRFHTSIKTKYKEIQVET